jgi:glycosyltransferase involved in cell wall biosynthesis
MEIKRDEPLISIITVVYNGDKYLEQTIKSVINQTYKNIEYIIIDGGSTDGTLDIIKNYENNIAYWISERDNGLYDAMNKGISQANGELIGTINSDDWYELDALESIVKAYLTHPEKKIFHSDRFNILENGEKELYKFNPSKFKFKYYAMTYSHPSMFISKDEYKIHQYRTEIKSGADYQFVMETFLRDETVIQYIEKVNVNFRLGGISSKLLFLQTLKEVFFIRKYSKMSILPILFSLLLSTGLYLIKPILKKIKK